MTAATRRTFVFAGGGTGGHLFPGLAVAEELVRREPTARIVFVGSDRPIERQILADTPFEHLPLPVESPRRIVRRPLRFLWRMGRSYVQVSRLLRTVKPSTVVGLGGFASALPVFLSQRRGIPTLLLEQNAIPGRATRKFGQRAKLVGLSFAESADFLPRGVRTELTGNPVRAEIAQNAEALQLPCTAVPVLLVLGGSQGARGLNDALLEVLPMLSEELDGWQIIHQTGDADAERISRFYENFYENRPVEERAGGVSLPAYGRRTQTCQTQTHDCCPMAAAFLTDLPVWYRRATVVVSRAGATTLAELACAGVPAVLVPYPGSADDHQRANAMSFANDKAAIVVTEQSTPAGTAAMLAEALRPLLCDPALRARMCHALRSRACPDAAAHVADHLERIAMPTESRAAAIARL